MAATELFEGKFFYANREIFEKEDLSGNAKLVYLYLSKCADALNKCWPAHKTISDACSISVSAVKTALQELKSGGSISISKRFREGGGKSSNMYMVMDRDRKKAFAATTDIFIQTISAKAKLVYLYLCRCAGKAASCFPAYRKIAAMCSSGISTVRKAIRELADVALVMIQERRRGDNGQTSNLYGLVAVAAQNTVSQIQEMRRRAAMQKEMTTGGTSVLSVEQEVKRGASMLDIPIENRKKIRKDLRRLRALVGHILAGGLGK